MYLNSELTENEQAVVKMYDLDDLTFAKIAEVLGLSRSRVSQIYHNALGKQRAIRREELYLEQNQKEISLPFKLGEVVVLKRILGEYLTFKMNVASKTRNYNDWNALQRDVDYQTANELQLRMKIEEKRLRKQIKL